MSINDLHAHGWTIVEIADKTGFHPATIREYLKHGLPPATGPTPASVMTEYWRTKIDSMLEAHPRLLSISIHNKMSAEGYDGSYPTVVRAVRDNRGPRFKAANAVSVPIHTLPRVTRPSSTSAICRRGRSGSGGTSRSSRSG